MQRGQTEAALESFDRALAIEPRFAKAHCNRGVALAELGQWQEALASYDQALRIAPGLASAHSNRAAVLLKLRCCEEALTSCDRALELKSDYAEAYCQRGNALRALNRLEAALASYEQALVLQPEIAVAHANRGAVLEDLGQHRAALASYDRAIALKPDYAEARFNRAVIALLLGDYRDWIEYEWRWRNPNGSCYRERRAYAQPRWLGQEPISGKTLLVHSEQGLGDTLQFCRYVPLVAALGANVVLEVQRPLAGLLSDLNGVAQLAVRGEALPRFDCYAPLLSMPLVFQTRLDTIPAADGYLRPDRETSRQWQQRLGPKRRPRIGLCWSGNPRNSNDLYRSIAAQELLSSLPADCDYFCLQRQVRPSDALALSAYPRLIDFGAELDFPATAALCELMDLVISVDTSIAHLSGALGKRTWVLLPRNGDWRWLLERSDSPWYHSVKLYRQPRLGDWGAVLQRVSADQAALFAGCQNVT
jgi:Flp pilus assembly protein TadD